MRGIVAVLAAGALFAGAAPALAGGNLTVKPNPVKQGKTLKVIASDCVSGSGFHADIRAIFNRRGDDDFRKKVNRQADASGTTKIAVKMSPRKRWLPGRYGIEVQCLHENGDSNVWYEEFASFRVKPPRV